MWTKKNPTDFSRVRLLNIHHFTASSRLISTRRRDEPAELIVMLGGVYKAHLPDSSVIEAHPREVLYWPANSHRTEVNDPANPTRCIALYFQWDRPPGELPRIVTDHHLLITTLAQRLLSLKEFPHLLPDTIRNAFLGALLAEFYNLSLQAVDPLVAQVARFATEHLSQAFSLDDLARHIGLNKSHLGRRFHKTAGLAPMRYVRSLRVQHAVSLLTATRKWPLNEVAIKVGFHDDRQLRRLIKAETGLHIRDLRQKKQSSHRLKKRADAVGRN